MKVFKGEAFVENFGSSVLKRIVLFCWVLEAQSGAVVKLQITETRRWNTLWMWYECVKTSVVFLQELAFYIEGYGDRASTAEGLDGNSNSTSLPQDEWLDHIFSCIQLVQMSVWYLNRVSYEHKVLLHRREKTLFGPGNAAMSIWSSMLPWLTVPGKLRAKGNVMQATKFVVWSRHTPVSWWRWCRMHASRQKDCKHSKRSAYVCYLNYRKFLFGVILCRE